MSGQNIDKAENSAVDAAIKVNKPKTSKIPVLLSGLALAISAYLYYQGVYGNYGIKARNLQDQQQRQELYSLKIQNQHLLDKINILSLNQTQIANDLQKINPSQTSLIIYQLNSLISGANQSLVLYHDYPTAIKQLNFAKELLISSSSPVFYDIKVKLSNDLDKLQNLNSFDNTMLAAQIENVYDISNRLTVASDIMLKDDHKLNEQQNIWQKFISNLKQSLLGVIKIAKTNQSSKELIIPENELVLRQHLQIDILNSRQALLNRNQQLWSTSLKDAITLLQNYFANDQLGLQALQILQELQQVHFNTNDVTLEATIQALIKLQQINMGK